MGTLLDATPAFVIVLILFFIMTGMTFCGHLFALARAKKNPDIVSEGIGSLEGALLGLVALMLAFTFSMSASRYDERRAIVVEEANAISTAVLRADLYPDSIREAFRNDFKEYIQVRIAYHESPPDKDNLVNMVKSGNALSDQLWKRATALSKEPTHYAATMQMIPALNAMIDIVTVRLNAGMAKVPQSILWLLFLLCIVSSFVVGYGKMSKRIDWIVVTGFSLMISLTIYLILDLDRPRRGLITMDSANERMIELRDMFTE